MTETPHEETHRALLHRNAEFRIDSLPCKKGEKDELRRLIHEIQIDQNELELQNDELSRRQTATEAAKRKYEGLYRDYAALFNFAPIGYLTIDRDGVIGDINLTAAILLNAPRSSLINRRITEFIHHEDQDGFYYQKLRCQKHEETRPFELKMKRADGFLFDAQFQMQPLSNVHGEEPRFSVALMDVSEQLQAFSSLSLQQRCLEIAATIDDMPALLEAFVSLVKDYLRCDAVGIRLLDKNGNIPYQAHDGFSRAFYASENPFCLHTDRCMCFAVIEGDTDPDRFCFTPKGSFYINDINRFLTDVSPKDRGKMCNTCNAHGYESVVLVPIPVDHAIQGLIHAADHRENNFPLRIVENLEAVGLRLGLAIQRFHLQETIGNTLDTLRYLSSHLLTAQEDEQRRISMELHDGCGQDLSLLKMEMKGLQRRLPVDAADLKAECDQLLTHADKIINSIRELAHGLQPAALDALGLAAAARQAIREFSDRTGIQVEMDVARLERIREPDVKICLFRILQEALTNIVKHSQATRVSVAVEKGSRDLQICIRDNGGGFDPQLIKSIRDRGQGMGLSAMKLRCRMIGATLSIDSETGKGTQLTVTVPDCPIQAAAP